MDDKIVRIEFNIWASSEEDGQMLREAIAGFIREHGEQGRKVSARKLAEAIGRWKENALVRNRIISYFQ